MSETPSPEPQKPLRRPEIFNKIKDIFNRKKAESKEEEQQRELQMMAEEVVTLFMSAEKQNIKRVILPNKDHPDTSIKDIAHHEATILRVEGHIRHRLGQDYFWFVLIKKDGVVNSFVINTSGRMTELRPQVSPLQLKLLKSFSPEDAAEPIPIRFFLNELTNYPHDDELAQSTEIDIMFGGSPEKNKPKTQAASELATAYSTA